jgi:5-methylcytosine-specific restriction endonuclease McrA
MATRHKCAACGETRLSEFWVDNRKGPGGLQTYCKTCSRAKRDAWASENTERVAEYHTRRKPKPHKRTAMSKGLYDQVASNNRRALERNPDAGKIRTREWENVLKGHEGGCPSCKQPWVLVGAPTLDHIIPIALGGKNLIQNVQPLCRSCNSRKSKKTQFFIRTSKSRKEALAKLKEDAL